MALHDLSSRDGVKPGDGEKKQETGPRWVWFITGPTACGKTTVAKYLADKLGFSFVEGDDFHPQSNREKMARNEALTDEDRAAWLDALRKQETAPSSPTQHRVVTCSALKRQYRDVLRGGEGNGSQLEVRFVFLDVEEEELRRRARERKGHFAGEGLVQSQMQALERPAEEDERDVIVVRVQGGGGVEETQRKVLSRVRETMGL
ncbi:putative gluconokinase [Corynascus novoguineensis]|uniref:Gluconokinase n=1 Tax=Corynascus novoguineensis TaxID=1126955 RepID=A0AAN7CPZ0_9PEZI|nr:putative gluconokinase [Corynascus novoguineensis]